MPKSTQKIIEGIYAGLTNSKNDIQSLTRTINSLKNELASCKTNAAMSSQNEVVVSNLKSQIQTITKLLDDNRKELDEYKKEVDQCGMYKTNITKLLDSPNMSLGMANAYRGLNIDSKILLPVKGSDLEEDLMDMLNLILIQNVDENTDRLPIVGSYKWRIHKYPGDIDLMEIYEISANNKKEAQEKIAKELQKIAVEMSNNSNVRLGDFKSGYDTRFDGLIHNMGTLRTEYANEEMIAYFEETIPNYNKEKCQEEINKLYNVGAINEQEKSELLNLLPLNMTGPSYSNMVKKGSILRKRRLLRWTLSEMIQGIKIVPSMKGENYTIGLSETVAHFAITKIDIWVRVKDRWIEMTNLFVFKFKNTSTGQLEPIGFTFVMGLDEAIALDLAFYSSPKHEKPVKLAKRIWNRAVLHCYRAVKNGQIMWNEIDPTQWHILKKIYPLFAADIFRIAQINSDLELFVAALNKRVEKNIGYEFMFKYLLQQVDIIPGDLFRMATLGIDDKEMTTILRDVKNNVHNILSYIQNIVGVSDYRDISNNQWNTKMDDDNINKLTTMLEHLMHTLKEKHNEYAKSFLILNKLHPRYEGSIVQYKYTKNYLNLPPVVQKVRTKTNIPAPAKQMGGARQAYYRKKYLKYKKKYINLKRYA
uniref:Uncharacterized protein n=1 Tax=Mimivirus LCMiAC01 TaxID=2506608 RepID=A0A481YZB0_9VIRU|nr:MAG: hypothetical protein LCMiAC01_02700 [Mimivirus LCMiAC01]